MSNSRNLADLDIGVGGLLPASNMATGAAVSNIGYTPVNNAGGTMTGALTATGFTGPLTGNAATATNVAYSGLTGTVPTWNQNTTGNAATATTTTGNAATATTATNQSGGTVSATSISDSGNLAFTGTGNRITGDFSNATVASRAMFQTSTVNGVTQVSALPNGTGQNGGFTGYGGSDPANASFVRLSTVSATESRLESGITGTGTYLPMTMWTGGSERVRVDTSGNVGVGTSSPSSKLAVLGSDGVGFTGITSTNSNTNVGIAGVQFGSDPTYIKGAIGLIRSNANGVGSLVFYNDSNTDAANWSTSDEKMRIDSSGNLGIGTSSPTTRLSVVSGTNAGISVSDGTVNTIIYNSTGGVSSFGTTTNHPVDFYTNNAARMRIDSSGNLGIGTSSPANKLDVTGTIGAVNVSSSTGTNHVKVQVNNTGGSFQFAIENSAGSNFGAPAYSRVLWNDGAYPTVFYTSSAERARIDSSGNFFVGATSFPALGNEKFGVQGGGTCAAAFTNNAAGQPTAFISNVNTGTVTLIRFSSGSSGTTVGSITGNGTNAAYNTSSDYRLKEAIAPMTGALAKVALLKPCTYKWKVDGSDGQGFIAHELAEVVAGCVTGEKDAVDADGKPQYQGIDTSFLVATLAAAIQELKAIVDAQGAEIAALKSI